MFSKLTSDNPNAFHRLCGQKLSEVGFFKIKNYYSGILRVYECIRIVLTKLIFVANKDLG
jgi:hypothetical protein